MSVSDIEFPLTAPRQGQCVTRERCCAGPPRTQAQLSPRLTRPFTVNFQLTKARCRGSIEKVSRFETRSRSEALCGQWLGTHYCVPALGLHLRQFRRRDGLVHSRGHVFATEDKVSAEYFESFFMAGFECSSHRRSDGVRLDLIGATSHDKHVRRDYAQCRDLGFTTLRDVLRWHLIEKSPAKYDWSSWLPMLEAAEEVGVQVIWDLFHYGSPDHADQGAPGVPERFTEFSLAALEVQQSVSGPPPLVCPLNEINFLSWAVDDGYFPP